jgi:hypothetical protein
MSEFSAECQAANRIAAQLRGLSSPKQRAKFQAVPVPKRVRKPRAVATGIPGKGNYLKLAKQALMPEVLAYCREFFAENDQLPTQACIAQRFKVTEQTGHDYLHRLAKEGHIERNAVGKWRFARNLPGVLAKE